MVIISAGVFIKEWFEEPDHDAEVTMYKTSAIGPIFITRALFKKKSITKDSKLILVSSEAGSITLRHESEGGGMYGHHASKAALNMVGKLLSLDLKPHGIAVALVHPAFMRTEMTKNVGFDKFWDDGGAVEPEEAASSLREWVDTFDISKTGEYWAPRGPRYVCQLFTDGRMRASSPLIFFFPAISVPLSQYSARTAKSSKLLCICHGDACTHNRRPRWQSTHMTLRATT